MFWKKKAPDRSERACAHELYEYLCRAIGKDNRIRVEDLITTAASIVAERCIETAGDFNPRQHQFVPGARVFSTKVNELFSGDTSDLNEVPSESIVGILRDQLLAAGYNRDDFPSLEAVFEYYAAHVGNKSDWGKAPLSIPNDNKPFVLPLRVSYESRPIVDRLFQTLDTPEQRLRAAVLTLVEALVAVRQVADNRMVLTLALETINGMAKTAPMTDEAMAAAKKQGGGQTQVSPG